MFSLVINKSVVSLCVLKLLPHVPLHRYASSWNVPEESPGLTFSLSISEPVKHFRVRLLCDMKRVNSTVADLFFLFLFFVFSNLFVILFHMFCHLYDPVRFVFIYFKCHFILTVCVCLPLISITSH